MGSGRTAKCGLCRGDDGTWRLGGAVLQCRAAHHKPILLYWLIMSAYGVFGVNEFSARFWSAALAVGTVLATYGIGRRLFHANVGFWAAVILATSLMFDVAGRAATPDSALIFCSTAALLIYVLTAFPADGTYFPQRWWAAGAMYALMGLAVLAKGPVGAVLPTAVIGMFLLIVRLPETVREVHRPAWQRWLLQIVRPFSPSHFLRTCWSMRPLTAIVVILAVAGPWYAWVGWRTGGEFLRVFFGEHNLGRATQAMEGHSGGLWYYPVAIPGSSPGRYLRCRWSATWRGEFAKERLGSRATCSPSAGSACTWACFRWPRPSWPVISPPVIQPWRC